MLTLVDPFKDYHYSSFLQMLKKQDGKIPYNNYAQYQLRDIDYLIEEGYLVVPASGRDLKRMEENILTMSGIRYAVTLNGAQVYELPGKAVIADGTEIRQVRRIGEFPLSEEEAVNSLRNYCDILIGNFTKMN